MLKRIITAIVALCVFVPMLIFSDTWVFPAGIAFCAVVGILEILGCVGQKKNLFLTIPLCIIAAFFPIYARFSYLYPPYAGGSLDAFLKLGIGIVFLCALYIFGVAVFANKTLPITDAGLIFAVSFYIIASFTAIICMSDYESYVYLMIFIAAWITDTFAYFVGRLIGKHKLIPAVSPKKTVEGAIGGVVFCVISMLIFGFAVEMISGGGAEANYLLLALSGIFISVVSQIGDLVMSAIKRHYGIKDYGKLFPGHGGILDRFDSVIAVSLIFAFICMYFDFFA